CRARISARPATSGRSTTTWRSNLPGRRSALSRISGRFVAAITTMPDSAPKPSISTSIWLSVCSRSSWPWPMPAPRWRPTASSSSMKMIAGAARRACRKRSRTRADAGGADADERLDELRAREREEVRGRLARDGAREQRLAGTGRADQQDALRGAGAEVRVLLRRFEVVADLAELDERLGRAGDIR